MKDFINRLLKAMNFSGRDWAVLLLALLLAFSTWLIHNLSLRYNDYLGVYVVAHCNIDGHSEVSANRCEVIARCRTTGYNVIHAGIRHRKSLDINFKPSEMKHKEGDTFFVTSSVFFSRISFFSASDSKLFIVILFTSQVGGLHR